MSKLKKISLSTTKQDGDKKLYFNRKQNGLCIAIWFQITPVVVTIQSLELIKFLNGYYGNTDEEVHWKVADVSCFHLVAPICLTPDHMDHPKGHNPIFRAVCVKSKTKDKSIKLLHYMNFTTLM